MLNSRGRQKLDALLTRLFSIDLRALGVFRILLAVVLLLDYAGRLPDLDAHYTEMGVMPLHSAQEYHGTTLWLLVSPYTWNGSHNWSLTLMTIGMIAAVGLFVGWKTRFWTILSWFLLIGLQTRYPLVQEGGDVYIRQMLFWSMFLPLGARYSIDGLAAQHIAHKRPLPRSALSAATAAILIQIVFVYIFNAVAKSSPHWWRDFDAIYIALNLDSFTTPLGTWILYHAGWMLKPLTAFTIFLEAFGALFAYIPVATERIRPFVVLTFWGFHLIGIGLCMDVGPFCYVAALPWLLYLPSWVWDRFGEALSRFPHAQSRQHVEKARDQFVDWRSRRIVRLIRKGSALPRLTPSLTAQVLVVFSLCYALLWNMRETNHPWILRNTPRPPLEVMWLTRLDQFWGMFAPYPLAVDAWVVIPAQTIEGRAEELKGNKEGSVFDLYKMRAPVNFSKPRSVHEFYKNSRWRKYLTNLYETRFANQRLYYCQWLAREWNRTHHGPQALSALWYCVVEEPTLPDYQQPKLSLRVLHVYFCAPQGPHPEVSPPGVPKDLLPTPPKEQGAATNGVNRSR